MDTDTLAACPETWAIIRWINELLEEANSDHRVALELRSPYDKMCVSIQSKDGDIERLVSPWLADEELHSWLSAYWQGVSLGIES